MQSYAAEDQISLYPLHCFYHQMKTDMNLNLERNNDFKKYPYYLLHIYEMYHKYRMYLDSGKDGH